MNFSFFLSFSKGKVYSEKMIEIGNHALVFIQCTLSGDAFPFGARLSADMAFYGRNEIVEFLSYLHPRLSGGLLYTNLRTLLHFNTQDFFNLLTMAFDNEGFLRDVDILKRRSFCDILLRVMVDDVHFSSHEISILFRFLSRQLAKQGQQHIFVQGMLFEQVRKITDAHFYLRTTLFIELDFEQVRPRYSTRSSDEFFQKFDRFSSSEKCQSYGVIDEDFSLTSKNLSIVFLRRRQEIDTRNERFEEKSHLVGALS